MKEPEEYALLIEAILDLPKFKASFDQFQGTGRLETANRIGRMLLSETFFSHGLKSSSDAILDAVEVYTAKAPTNRTAKRLMSVVYRQLVLNLIEGYGSGLVTGFDVSRELCEEKSNVHLR